MLIGFLINHRTYIKHFLSYFVLFLISISLVGIIIYSVAMKIIREETQRVYVSTVNGIKNSIDTRMDEINKLNDQIINNRLFYKPMNMNPDMDPERVSIVDFLAMTETLASYKSSNSFIDEIFFYFANNKIIVTSTFKEDAAYLLKNIIVSEDRRLNIDFLDYTGEKNSLIPNYTFNYFGREYEALVYVQRVSRELKNHYSGAIITITNKNSIERILNDFTVNDKFLLYIVDRSNNVIAGNVPFKNSDFSSSVKFLGENTIYHDDSGNIIYHVTSSVPGWEYVACAPIGFVAEKAEKFRDVFLVSFPASILFGLIFLMFLTGRSLNPVYRILSSIQSRNLTRKRFSSDFELIEECINDMQNEKQVMEKDIESYKHIKQNLLLGTLTRNNCDVINPAVLAKYDIVFHNRDFMAVLFEFSDEIYLAEYDQEKLLNKTKIIIKDSFFFADLEIFPFTLEDNKICFVFNLDDKLTYEEINIRADFIVEKLKFILEKETDSCITAGIGSRKKSLGDYCISYNEAVQALAYKLIKGRGSVVRYREISGTDDYTYYYPLEKELALIEGVMEADYVKIEGIIDEIVSRNLHKNNPDLSTAKFLYFDLQATAFKAIQQVGFMEYYTKVTSHELGKVNTFNDMIEFIKKIYKELCMQVKSKKESIDGDFITNLLAEIEKNICDPNLSLNFFASKYGLSDSTLSRFFREHTGMYYSDYINRKRIDKAKEMLESNKATVKDIGLKVGFINDVTFRRVFKKIVLTTPAKYRSQKDNS